LFSLTRLDLQRLRRERNPHSETLHALLDQPRRLIISILSGNELVNIAAAANMAGILVTLYGAERAGWVSVLVMVPLLLLFGEVTPKTIAVSNPVRVSSSIVASPLNVWVRFVTPIVWALRGISDWITTFIVGEEKAAENILQVDEFRTLVDASADEGELNATERALIYNLLEADDTEIVEIMTPRTRTRFLNADLAVEEMVELFKSFEHPRVPVFRGHRDNLVGFIHAEDVVRIVLDQVDVSKVSLESIMHPPVVVPPTKKVDEMFDFFQQNRVRAAAVLNEFGGVDGFITMKDVLTFIFGEIAGRVRGEELYQERDENVYEVPGDMTLNDFNNLTNFGLEDPRMTTIAGVAFRHLDRLPKVGDKVEVEGLMITVLQMDSHRISRVRVAPTESDADFEDGDQTDVSEAGESPARANAGPTQEAPEDSTAADISLDEEAPGPPRAEKIEATVIPAESEMTGTDDGRGEAEAVAKPVTIASKKRPKRR
jgi:CBS domain containing-hemolysin-like protein